jgi:hypothetical protein
MAGLQTEFSFVLPKGFIDEVGVLHRQGVMRLATARDEIEPLRSTQIDSPDDPYLTVLVLARVVKELGTLERITPATIENLFAADLAFLQDLYGIINFGDPADVAALQAMVTMPAQSPRADDQGSPDASASDDEWFAEEDDAVMPSVETESFSSMRPRARIEEVRRVAAP